MFGTCITSAKLDAILHKGTREQLVGAKNLHKHMSCNKIHKNIKVIIKCTKSLTNGDIQIQHH